MASIANDPNGRRRILFTNTEGERKAIRLGKVSQRAAEAFKLRVEQLIEAQFLRASLSNELAQWVADLTPTMAQRLAKVGLIADREAKVAVTLGDHLTQYLERRSDVKPNTRTHWNHTVRNLLGFFGAERPLVSINPGEARDWERWLKSGGARENRYVEQTADDGLASNTVRKRVSNAKQFFHDAVERGLIAKNPFAGLKGTVGNNPERSFFVTREMADKVLAACPDLEWRLIFALCRFGGLRCPSEHLALTWADVNWAENKFLVRSSKTEHHEGKGTRWVPLFPELRQLFDQAFDAAEQGATHVITRYRDTNMNLRTQLQRIIRRAGLESWPKLFQNLRASRATELANQFPAHVAAAWLGHSTLIANKHYWQVTDDDFARATSGPDEAAQKAAQSLHAESRLASQTLDLQNKKPRDLPGFAATCDLMHSCGMGIAGLEPATPTV